MTQETSHTEDFLILNGKLESSNNVKGGYMNRAFLMGDGVFESIRLIDGEPCFIDMHLKRMKSGLEKLKIALPAGLNSDKLCSEIKVLTEKLGIDKGGRVRLTTFRSSGGYYIPDNNSSEYVITAAPLVDNLYTLNETGLNIDLYTEIKKPYTPLTPYKTLNSQLYVVAGLWAKENRLDDCLLQNDRMNIIESTSSNVFLICNGVLYTPAITDGCLAGIMRMQIINLAIENNLKVYECPIMPQNLLVADEIFLTNSIKGLQWISGYKTKRYFNTITKRLTDLLNRKIFASRLEKVETTG